MDVLNFPNEPEVGDRFHRWFWDGEKWALGTPPSIDWSTGDVQLTFQSVADDGWIMCNDGSIGNDGSGATDTGDEFEALFYFLFDNLSDAAAPLFDPTGTQVLRVHVGSGSAWALGYRIALSKMLGRALAVAGANHPLGQAIGAETHTLTENELAGHAHSVYDPSHGHSVYDGGHAHGWAGHNAIGWSGHVTLSQYTHDIAIAYSHQNWYLANVHGAYSGMWLGGRTSGIGVYGAGGNQPHNNMQPTAFLNAMIKL